MRESIGCIVGLLALSLASCLAPSTVDGGAPSVDAGEALDAGSAVDAGPVCATACEDDETCCAWGCGNEGTCWWTGSAESTCPAVQCGEPPAGYEATLTDIDGCSDVWVSFANPEASIIVEVIAPNLLYAAFDSGEPEYTRVFQLPDDEVQVSLTTGARVTVLVCDDVAFPAVTTGTWSGQVEGTVEVRLTNYLQGAEQSRAWVAVTGVSLKRDGDLEGEVTIDSLVAEDVRVGWFPG